MDEGNSMNPGEFPTLLQTWKNNFYFGEDEDGFQVFKPTLRFTEDKFICQKNDKWVGADESQNLIQEDYDAIKTLLKINKVV